MAGLPQVLVTFLFLDFPFVTGSASRGEQRSIRGSSSADVYYASEMADRFAAFAAKHQAALNDFHAKEQQRIEAAIVDASSESDKSLLELTATRTEESRLEAVNAFGEMRNFVTTLKHLLGATSTSSTCRDLTCGVHAYCSSSAKDGAQCRCEDGYEGNGFVCNPPLNFQSHPLLAAQRPKAQISDMHVSMLQGGIVALVYRDISKFDQGYVMLGLPSHSDISWSSPTLFTNHSQAFSPVLTKLQDGNGFSIAFRDKNRGGTGLLLAGNFDPVSTNLTLGSAKAFARHQAQTTAIYPLPESRVVIFFSEHVTSGAGRSLPGGAMYGSALVAKVHPEGGAPPDILGKQRFVFGPVARISATMLTPTSFAVAYRQGEGAEDDVKAEASCNYASLHGNELVFGSNPVRLEPEQTQIWARSVSFIQDNTFAYVYHSGTEAVTKQAVLRADPKTRDIKVIRKPEVIGRGFSPWVGAVSTATPISEQPAEQLRLLQLQGPRIFTYFGTDDSRAKARMCRVNAENVPDGCQEVEWSARDLANVAGTPMGDGRLLLAFADSNGTPSYQLVGLMEPEL